MDLIPFGKIRFRNTSGECVDGVERKTVEKFERGEGRRESGLFNKVDVVKNEIFKKSEVLEMITESLKIVVTDIKIRQFGEVRKDAEILI